MASRMALRVWTFALHPDDALNLGVEGKLKKAIEARHRHAHAGLKSEDFLFPNCIRHAVEISEQTEI